VLLAVLAFVAALFVSDDLGDNPAAVLLGLGATGSALVSMFLAAAHVFSSRRDMCSGGQLPPQGVINTARNTRQLPHTAKPGRGNADAACRHCARPQLSG
jgi:hypothetical protein